MSDFVLHYDVLEGIAKTSNSLGRQADEYANSLTSRVANAITSVTGSSSGYLEDASYFVNEKVRQLQKKAQEFFDFATQVTILAETATRVDEEVQKMLAESQEEFLQHHESLRIDDWKADILNWLVGIKNKLPFLEVLGNILSAVDTLLETCLDSIKYWYNCEGGKYVVEFVGAIALAALAVAIFVLTLPASGFVAICGVIGAGIAAVNAITNVATAYRAAYTACNGDPTWARIYSKQNTLPEVIRDTNFNNGTLNELSYLGADVIDATEMVCCIVGFKQIGESIKKLFTKKNFNIFKKGSFHLGDFKTNIKNGFGNFKTGFKKDYFDFKTSIKKSYVDTKVNIKKGVTEFTVNAKDGYKYLKSNIKSWSFGKVDVVNEIPDFNKLDDIPANGMDNILSEGGFKSTLSELDAKGYNEFLSRTEGIFTSEADAQETFQQLLDRDFKGFAKKFNFSTEADKAYFWSGDKGLASNIAKLKGGTIMESTQGGQVIDNWNWLNEKFPSDLNWGTGNDLDPQPLWKAVSKAYAAGVKGKVTYVNQSYEGNIWLKVESPIVDILMDKGIVTDVDYYNKEFIINKILDEGVKGW